MIREQVVAVGKELLPHTLTFWGILVFVAAYTVPFGGGEALAAVSPVIGLCMPPQMDLGRERRSTAGTRLLLFAGVRVLAPLSPRNPWLGSVVNAAVAGGILLLTGELLGRRAEAVSPLERAADGNGEDGPSAEM